MMSTRLTSSSHALNEIMVYYKKMTGSSFLTRSSWLRSRSKERVGMVTSGKAVQQHAGVFLIVKYFGQAKYLTKAKLILRKKEISKKEGLIKAPPGQG